jgi:hypothetical protein
MGEGVCCGRDHPGLRVSAECSGKVEAYIEFQDPPSHDGYLLLWSGRAVYRDPSGKWWFTASPMIQPAK